MTIFLLVYVVHLNMSYGLIKVGAYYGWRSIRLVTKDGVFI